MTELEQATRPRLGSLQGLLRHFSPFERLVLYTLSIILALSTFVILAEMNDLISVQVPAHGGTLTEGGVGTPRFINPLLATSPTDEDLTALIYAGLLREKDDVYEGDAAERYEVSDDGRTYTFHLRDGLTFHDGEPLTTDDVVFTIERAKDPEARTTRRSDWEGVSVEAPDEKTVVFKLPHAYTPFLENATLGILPKHIWENIPAQEFPFSAYNTHPIGSGPYRVYDVETDASGAADSYSLVSFSAFALGEPNLSRITYRIYSSEEELLAAYDEGDIESFVSASPKKLSREVGDGAVRIPLSRIFAVFLNQNHAPVLANLSVRRALAAAIDTDALVTDVLKGYARPLSGPIPDEFLGTEPVRQERRSEEARIEEVHRILAAGGWKFTPTASSTENAAIGSWTKDKTTLTMTLSTADTEDLVDVANAIAAQWEKAGIPTDVQIYPLSDFNSNILRPRAYDAVVFGEVVGRSLDVYAFWHSSQRNDPGLNLALYTNAVADKALVLLRENSNPDERRVALDDFLKAIADDVPAVFLFAPDVVYIVPDRVQGMDVGAVTTAAERFVRVHEWYRDTERVWEIFN
jgi:peptide/nickel transport system substrate-binding protein